MGQHKHPKPPPPQTPVHTNINPALQTWLVQRAQKANLPLPVFISGLIDLGAAVMEGADRLVFNNRPVNDAMAILEFEHAGRKVRIIAQFAEPGSGLILPGRGMN